MRKSLKPRALIPGSTIAVVNTASPADAELLQKGCENLGELDYRVLGSTLTHNPAGYFAAPLKARLADLQDAFASPETAAVFCSRGGYGTAELLGSLKPSRWKVPKVFCGFSDLTTLHVFFWQKLRWATFYGPHVAGNFSAGANATGGYDPDSFMCAMTATNSGWTVPLQGEGLKAGTASGTLLGGCVTLLQTTLGTPWELDTRGAILLLEDVKVKPYQLDRILLQLKQAGKFKGVRGIILGEFPGSDPPQGSDVTVSDVCRRVLGPLGIPIVYGAAVGHTPRPMLTLPLGIQVRLSAKGEGRLDILEPAVHP
jgi:muramoyltetrapeptide carboxypeptidase